MSSHECAAGEADASQPVQPTVELIACETCGSKEELARHGSSDGERLGAWLRRLADSAPQVRVSSTRCLWACARSCAVHVRSLAPELTRVGYVIASLEPSEGAARALLDYAKLYAATTDGAVPFKQWPQPLRGHFLCRIPSAPLPAAAGVAPMNAAPETPTDT